MNLVYQITIIWKISTGPENISTQVSKGREGSSKCVRLRTRERSLILAIFVGTNYVMTAIIASKNRMFRRLMKWKNKIKRTKMVSKINKEFMRAQYQIFTLSWKKCGLYRKFHLGLAKRVIIWRFSMRVEISTR